MGKRSLSRNQHDALPVTLDFGDHGADRTSGAGDLKALLVVRTLPASATQRMRDLYPTAIRAHVDLGYETHVLQSDAPSTPESESFARDLGATMVPEASRHAERPGWLELSRDPLFFGPRRRFARSIAAAREFFEHAGPPDVVTGITSTKYAGVPAYLLARTFGVPFVVWEHLTHYQRPALSLPARLQAREALRACDRLVAVSEPLLANIRRCLELPLPEGGVLPNPIVDTFFAPPRAELPEVQAFRGGRFLCAGWTNWRDFKRLDVFLDAMSILPVGSFCAAVAGPTDRRAQRWVDRRGLQDRVLLLGPLDRGAIHALAYQCDCCVLSSDHETFGLPALEAMAAGKPVVTTASGGPETLIREPFLGRVIPKGSPEALAGALREVRAHPDRFPAQQIRAHAWENFSEAPFRDHWARLYRDLLGAQRSPLAEPPRGSTVGISPPGTT